jgi:predicted acylesterase/phospholipase RssA
LVLLVFCFGCARYPVNARLDNYDKDKGYRFNNLSSPGNSDSLFVILAFSGGGTRAAALSYGVLEQLKDSEIRWEGKSVRLLDEVDVISSVSGGSFTSAYYGLYGDRVFTEFETRFLKKDIQGELTKQLFYPINWFRLASPTFDRIDMAAKYYDDHVFDHHTFKELLKNGRRPFIIINATDMSLGARFEFSQDQFDLLCSNLTDFPVSRAVAASSAFPVLLSPITLKNYAGGCSFKEPEWVSNALNDRAIATRRYARATQARSYQDSTARPFIHLLDGGIADNIGLRGPYYAATSTDGGWSLLRMINMDKIHKVVVIVVNAGTDPDTKYDKQESAPGVKDVLSTVLNVPMDNYSFETIELLKESFDQWLKDAQARKDCEDILKANCPQAKLPGGPLAKVDFYPVLIAFDSLEDPQERAFFKNLPTTFTLPSKTVDRLRTVGAKLLNGSKEFKKLLEDLR